MARCEAPSKQICVLVPDMSTQYFSARGEAPSAQPWVKVPGVKYLVKQLCVKVFGMHHLVSSSVF